MADNIFFIFAQTIFLNKSKKKSKYNENNICVGIRDSVSLRKCEEYIVSLYFEFSAKIYIYTKSTH